MYEGAVLMKFRQGLSLMELMFVMVLTSALILVSIPVFSIKKIKAMNDEYPVGMMIPWSAPSSSPAPDGFLFAQGQLVNRADYPELFRVISTKYNTGGESGSQFRLPDMKRRMAIGLKSTDANFNDVKYGGVEFGAFTLEASNIPQVTLSNQANHTHSSSSPGTGYSNQSFDHYHATTGGDSSDHAHYYN